MGNKTQKDDAYHNVGRMIVDTAGMLTRSVDMRARALGITGAQWVILLRIGDGLGETPGHLCETIGYDSGAMTKILGRLENLGFIRRQQAKDDKRRSLLSLTTKGRALHPKLRPIANAVIEDHFKGFSVKDKELLMELLQRALDNGVTQSGKTGRGHSR